MRAMKGEIRNNFSTNLIHMNGNLVLIAFIISYKVKEISIAIALLRTSIYIRLKDIKQFNETIGRKSHAKIAKGMLSPIEAKHYIIALMHFVMKSINEESLKNEEMLKNLLKIKIEEIEVRIGE